MTIREYQKEALRTSASLGDLKLDLSHMTLGLMSELVEYNEAVDEVNSREELADIMWYVANYCSFRGYDLYELTESSLNMFAEEKDFFTKLTLHISSLSDLVKKYVAYGKEIDTILEMEFIGALAKLILDYPIFNSKRDLQNNIDKLKIRYPEKFTTENAINRDLEQERRELEKELFKVGDKVFDPEYGHGEIEFISEDPNVIFPIKVVFENIDYIEDYTLDGRYDTHEAPVLELVERANKNK